MVYCLIYVVTEGSGAIVDKLSVPDPEVADFCERDAGERKIQPFTEGERGRLFGGSGQGLLKYIQKSEEAVRFRRGSCLRVLGELRKGMLSGGSKETKRKCAK